MQFRTPDFFGTMSGAGHEHEKCMCGGEQKARVEAGMDAQWRAKLSPRQKQFLSKNKALADEMMRDIHKHFNSSKSRYDRVRNDMQAEYDELVTSRQELQNALEAMTISWLPQARLDVNYGLTLPEKELLDSAYDDFNARGMAPYCEIGASTAMRPAVVPRIVGKQAT